MEDEYDYSQTLLPEEIIGIIDQLLCHEVCLYLQIWFQLISQMAWHMGHPLSQTIFTSLYIDRLLSPCPLSLDQTYFDRSESCEDEPLTLQILRAYCLGLIKTCSYVNNRVKAEHYYEVRFVLPLTLELKLTKAGRKKTSSLIFSTEVSLRTLSTVRFQTCSKRRRIYFLHRTKFHRA